MVDLHSHVLPGVDDGPSRLVGSLALARAAVAAGTHVMAATPHIGLRYPIVPAELPARVAGLNAQLRRESIPLELVVGGELAPTRVADLDDAELRAIALGEGSCVLLECPFTRAGGLMSASVSHLQHRGFRVLLAHPERSPEFLHEPGALSALVRAGVVVQVTASSLRGDFGRTVRRFALEMLEAGLVHVIASDAHDATLRSPAVLPIVRDVVRRHRLAAGMTAYVTEDVPRALLADAPIPAPPAHGRKPLRSRIRGLARSRSAP
jgi:protein-tyrosine phosphatase